MRRLHGARVRACACAYFLTIFLHFFCYTNPHEMHLIILDTKKIRYARAFLAHFYKKTKKRKMMHQKNSKRSERADVCALIYIITCACG